MSWLTNTLEFQTLSKKVADFAEYIEKPEVVNGGSIRVTPREADSNPTRSKEDMGEIREPPHNINMSSIREHWERMLLEAAKNGHEFMVKQALRKEVDPNTQDELWGLTALHYAARRGHATLAQLLLKGGANANCVTRFTGDTPLFEAARNGYDEVVQILLAHGAIPLARGRMSRTALHEAAETGHLRITTLLLENGADQNATDARGETALDLATQENHKAVMHLLQQKQTPQPKISVSRRFTD